MGSLALDRLPQDGLALTVAQVLATANAEAVARGTDPAASLVTISEEAPPPTRLWRVHYGPRDFVHRRGGDLIVLVDEQAQTVQRVLRGQ